MAGCAPGERMSSAQVSLPTATDAPTGTPPPRATGTARPTLEPPTSTPQPTRTITPSPTPMRCWTKGGHFEAGSLSSPLLPLPLSFTVYLPPCYGQEPERRYPVLYLIHGQNYNNDQWDRLGADEAADRLISAGEASPFLMVLPRDRSWAQPSEDAFGQAIVEKLVPYIDEHYPTLPERAYRAVGGLSRGAGWAVHLGLSHPELFGAIGAHSLPVFWADTSHIRAWLDAIPEEDMPRIYIDIGDKDRPSIMESTLWFENLLTERDIPHQWHLFPGYHEEAYWSAHVEDYLRWYTREW
jgi:enterochelin esterase-like enzyme